MRVLPLLVSMTLGSLVARHALGDEKSICAEAYKQAQSLRDDRKLVETRDQLRICGRRECPGFIVKDCTSWLADVETALPTVVFAAKDDAGGDLVDVRVTMDGVVVATALDGRSFPINPGEHTFELEWNGQKVSHPMIVREGAKEQQVAVTFKRATTTDASGIGADGKKPDAAPTSDSGRTMRTAGFIAGGAGIVGLAAGAIFGIQAISKNNSAGCNAQSECLNAQDRTDAQSAATVSTVGFVVGGVALAGGVALVLLAPSGSRGSIARIEAAPMVGAGSEGIVLRGWF
jgi:hypothetical protein